MVCEKAALTQTAFVLKHNYRLKRDPVSYTSVSDNNAIWMCISSGASAMLQHLLCPETQSQSSSSSFPRRWRDLTLTLLLSLTVPVRTQLSFWGPFAVVPTNFSPNLHFFFFFHQMSSKWSAWTLLAKRSSEIWKLLPYDSISEMIMGKKGSDQNGNSFNVISHLI